MSSAHASAPSYAQPGDESQSEFGSFTGHDSQPPPWLSSAPQVEFAQDYMSEADLQAPIPLHAVVSPSQNGVSNGEAYAGHDPALRPATAAARASLLQSMDRSVPISLGLFGEESYEDDALDAADQPGVQGPGPASHQGYASGHAPASSSGLPQRALSDPEPSWQQAHAPAGPSYTSPAWLPDQAAAISPDLPWQAAAPSDPSTASLPQQTASSIGPTSVWPQADPEAFQSASPLPDQNQHMFAATWPQPATGTSLPHSPSRQALSGPISLELFGLEEREDEPLHLPAHTLPAPPADTQLPGTAHQSSPSFADSNQPPPGGHLSPGPIALELSGAEESSDASLVLPLQAAITVLPTAASMSGQHTAPRMPCN